MPGFGLGPADFGSSLLWLFKLLMIVGGLCYLVFAFLVIRQISIMKKTLITPLSPEVSLLGWLHLTLTSALFLYFIFGLSIR